MPLADQTSCHNPFGGGYTPVQLNYEQVCIQNKTTESILTNVMNKQASEMLAKDPSGFHDTVQESLRRWIILVHHIQVKWNHCEKTGKGKKRMNQI